MATAALTTIALAAEAHSDDSFHAPEISEFFPNIVLFAGTPFEMNRIMIIRVLVALVLVLVFWLGTRNMKLIPGRGQNLIELGLGFVRTNIADEILGHEMGKRWLPLLTTFFFMIFGLNITGIIPGLNIAGTAVVGVPLLLALIAYVSFIYAGIKAQGGKFFKNALFPAGVPWYMYFLVTPIEFLSTFVIRPVALTLRLLMNMVAGHLLLVLCFSATHFFLLSSQVEGGFRLFGPLIFIGGFAFTLFEILVAVLQAYIFTLLTAVYIQQAAAEEH